MTLHPGDEIQCPNCRRWHSVHYAALELPVYLHTRTMLYFTCRGGEYFAGSEGSPSHHPIRMTSASTTA